MLESRQCQAAGSQLLAGRGVTGARVQTWRSAALRIAPGDPASPVRLKSCYKVEWLLHVACFGEFRLRSKAETRILQSMYDSGDVAQLLRIQPKLGSSCSAAVH